jgi:hypothetical protein
MRKSHAFVLAAIVAALAPAAPAAAKLGPNPSNRALATELVKILHEKDYTALKAFLAPAFLIQRADGSWLTKSQYLAKPAVIESYTITDIHGTRDGNVRVLRYTLQTKQTINGQLYSQDPVPRLSTYVKHGKTWQIISHANFNAPAPTG